MGCSVDSHFSHLRWKEMDVNKGGIGNIQYPLVADLDKSIARKYDVLVGSEPATVYTESGEELETTVGGGVALRGSFLTKRVSKRYRCIVLHPEQSVEVQARDPSASTAAYCWVMRCFRF